MVVPLSTTHDCLAYRLDQAVQEIHQAWTVECCNLTDGKEQQIIQGLRNDYRAVAAVALLPVSGLQVKRRSVRTQDLVIMKPSSGLVLQACRLA